MAEEPETCDLCASTGPPVKPPSTAADLPDAADDLEWIACSKCDKWLHSVCVAKSPTHVDLTMPLELKEQMQALGDTGPWFDWTDPVSKWYCPECIAASAGAAGKKPLVTTLKRRKRLSGAASPSKRARMSTEGSQASTSTGHDASAADGRPKRKAALDRPDYWNMHHHNATPTKGWIDLIKDPKKHGRVIKPDNFPRVPGELLRRPWLDGETVNELPPTLFYGPTREPLVVRPENGGLASMGGKVPGPSLTVDDVSRLVGPEKMVDVIDVNTQQSSQWPLHKWADYIRARQSGEPGSSKVYNIISLEISETELAKQVRPPSIVSDIDWVENYWPFPGGKEETMRAANATQNGHDVKGKAKSEWPKVQLYCLMGTKDSWTDWHIDFAASSVYYNVHTGSKVFFFIRPTESNLAAYAQWSGSHELQSSTWLPDLCDEVRKVTLVAGDTMIIPAGYIHAVFTPVDSIVFGGNFVHSYDIPTQLRLRQIEIDTKVPQRFRFPFFDTLCWHVATRHVETLRAARRYRPSAANGKGSAVPCEHVLRGLRVLAQFLIDQVKRMHSDATEDKIRRLIHGRIPPDVAEPLSLAHELKWRVEDELPDLSEDVDEVQIYGRRKGKAKPKARGDGLKLLSPVEGNGTWTEHEPTFAKTSQVVSAPRPGGAEARAERTTATHKQAKSRVFTNELGQTVREERDLLITERRFVWNQPEPEAQPAAPAAATGPDAVKEE